MTTIILIGLLGTVVLAVLTAVSLALLHAFTRYHFEDGGIRVTLLFVYVVVLSLDGDSFCPSCVRLAESESEPYVQAGYQSIRTRGAD